MGATLSEKMYVNELELAEYGAKADRNSISIGGTKITNDYFQGRNRSHYTLMATTFGLKTVKFKLIFQADLLKDAKLNKSRLEAEMYGGCELYMPDGYYYRCMLDSIGDDVTKGVDGLGVLIECDYQLSGIQHDAMVTVEDGTSFVALGTLARMDCILTVTVSEDATEYMLGGAKFSNVHAGDVLVVDGINKRFLKNGAWVATTDWLSFPYVTPDNNSFTAVDTVKVQYYPSYI